jgi:4-hydroxy-2-oxoheptanedioate aldolase
MTENKWAQLLKSKRLATGIYNFIPSETIVEVAGYAGLDFIIFDTEHASYDVAYIERGVRTAASVGLVSVVRISGTDPDQHLIARVLDTGVDGLMFARIQSKEVAEELVRMCRIPPVGTRGACPGSRSGHFALRPLDEYRQTTNDVALMVMIETKEAFDEAEEIMRVPGIEGVAVGRDDLAAAMGLPGGRHDPKAYEAERHILKLADTLGVGVRTTASTTDEMEMYLQNDHCPYLFSFLTDSFQFGTRLRS